VLLNTSVNWQVVFYGFFWWHFMIRTIFCQKIYDWFVGGLMSYLRYLSLLTHSGVQHISCVFVVFVFVLCHVRSLLPVSMDCPFLITPSIFINIYLYHLETWQRILPKVHFFYLFLKPRIMQFSDKILIYVRRTQSVPMPGISHVCCQY
jgi:hypothetical protein